MADPRNHDHHAHEKLFAAWRDRPHRRGTFRKARDAYEDAIRKNIW